MYPTQAGPISDIISNGDINVLYQWHLQDPVDADEITRIDGIAVDNSGNIYVTSESNHTVVKYDNDGKDANIDDQEELNKRLCRELAACGFYRFKNTHIIRCAYCGVTIEPKSDQSIMSQHRRLANQLVNKEMTMTTTTNDQPTRTKIDCIMVRAQCPGNIAITHRERFPEYPQYQSIFDRIQSFERYKARRKSSTDNDIRDVAEAGFFFDGKHFEDRGYLFSCCFCFIADYWNEA